MQGDAARSALAEAVHRIIAHGVVARVEAHGVETLKIGGGVRKAIRRSSGQHREILSAGECDRGTVGRRGGYVPGMIALKSFGKSYREWKSRFTDS